VSSYIQTGLPNLAAEILKHIRREELPPKVLIEIGEKALNQRQFDLASELFDLAGDFEEVQKALKLKEHS
jgi:hypothetical protein